MDEKKNGPYTKYGSSCIPLETVELNTPYTLTLNPGECIRDKKTDTDLSQHNVLLKYVRMIAEVKNVTFKFVPEYSAVSSRMHLHGVVHFKTHLAAAQFWGVKANFRFNYELDKLNDENWVQNYMYKQRQFMEPLMTSLMRDYVLSNKTVKPMPKKITNNYWVEEDTETESDLDT